MSEDWADKTAEQLASRGLLQGGVCLILGGVDTGKTTLAAALTARLAQGRLVGVIDADIGQSHIGPPATVGWAIVDGPKVDFSELAPGGISFVGDVTPVGHLLQFTAALTQCVREVSEVAEHIIIDTPGFVSGPAAAALWWTLQRIVQPRLILAVQRENELSDILAGLQHLGSPLEPLKSPPQIPTKSAQARCSYRQRQFRDYFQGSCLYNVSLSTTSVQTGHNLTGEDVVSRLVALRDEKGTDLAIGIVSDWQSDRDTVVVRAPALDVSKVRCLVVGDATIDIAGG